MNFIKNNQLIISAISLTIIRLICIISGVQTNGNESAYALFMCHYFKWFHIMHLYANPNKVNYLLNSLYKTNFIPKYLFSFFKDHEEVTYTSLTYIMQFMFNTTLCMEGFWTLPEISFPSTISRSVTWNNIEFKYSLQPHDFICYGINLIGATIDLYYAYNDPNNWTYVWIWE